MPTTIAHIIGGYAAAEGASGRRSPRLTWPWVGLFGVIVANLPDVDFLIGLAFGGSAVYFHRGFTHSFVFGALVASVLTFALVRWWPGRKAHLWVLLYAAYSSHLVLDVIFPDPSGGNGATLLWPFTRTWFQFPLPFLEPLGEIRLIPVSGLHTGFFSTVFSTPTALVFLVDALVVLPLIPLAIWWARARRSGRARTPEPRPVSVAEPSP